MSKQEVKSQLDPEIISKLKTLELKAKYVVEGFMVGIHKSPYHGFSVEFSQHRQYNQGDAIKHIDWKLFAKREKYFIKQYEEETNLICNILLDKSKSMDFKKDGHFSKLEYGKILASSLVYLLNQQQDSVGLTLYSDEIEKYFPPKANRVYSKKLLAQLENTTAENKTATEKCLIKTANLVNKRGLTIIISDFFDDFENIISAIKKFHFKQNEVILFQILDPIELSFAFDKESIFVDMESEEKLSAHPLQIQAEYQRAFKSFLNKLKSECLKLNVEYNLITTNKPFDKALLSYFKKRSLLY